MWEGTEIIPCNTTSPQVINKILTLIDDVNNYDTIQFYYYWYNSSSASTHNMTKKEFKIDMITNNMELLITINSVYCLASNITFPSNTTVKIIGSSSFNTSGNTSGNAIKISKIVGVKYKTFSTPE